ncbi:MAG: hydrogenase maturation nickel metallochaperone HypA [Eubacterium sp.]|nr:hydrogenase maturation nickel metallochaperone HypA [Eubacterium sp.]
MHEMSYVVRFVNQAIESVKNEQAGRVSRLFVSVGEMTDVLPEYLHKYYTSAVEGTILEGSTLEVEMVPVRVQCAGCGQEYHPDREHKYLCPFCSDGNGKVIAGRDVVLEKIEIVS